MATKEKLTTRAARLREEARETGKVVLRAPALVRTAECIIRFLLGALLAGAEIFDGYTPFGLGLVGASGSGLDGFCALLGACFGYLTMQGFAEGLRYTAACILAFSVAFAFFDVKAYQKSWFMPLAAAAMDGITGFIYLSDQGWTQESLVFFATEVLLCGASAYFYRIAFTPWTEKREEEGLTPRQTVSLLILAGTLMLTLSNLMLPGELSVGRLTAALAVMLTASQGGIGVGATVGVAAGLAMDLAAGGMPFYSMAYALAGVMAGVFHRQGRLASVVAYVISNGLAVLWTWEEGLHIALLYEVFIASVIFLVLPQKALRQVGALVAAQPRQDTRERARAYVRTRLEETASAFRELYQTMRATLRTSRPNDGDAAAVFDRTADRVCKHCSLQTACWQRDYVSTFNALNDALPAMLERGRGEGGDFPAYFANRCIKFPEFLAAANEEVAALLYRRQYRSRLQENRAAVCRQYGELSQALDAAAAELGAELVPDPVREKRLRQYLTAQGIECELAAYYDEAGHLRLELEGAGLSPLRQAAGVEKLSKLVNFPLRIAEGERRDKLVLVQSEPLMAVAGAACRKKEGQMVSGDTGAWFKHDDGALYVLLCDGMGSGRLAQRESTLAVRLLEQFLKAGVRPENALRTVSAALALRGEEEIGFTTIDLLRVDLFTGEAAVYKYGAAPTYVKQGSGVSRITGASLPAGLAGGEGGTPDVSQFRLEAGDCVALVTDGVAGGGSDQWVRDKLAAFDGASPRALAEDLLEESGRQVGAADDRTVLVLKIARR